MPTRITPPRLAWLAAGLAVAVGNVGCQTAGGPGFQHPRAGKPPLVGPKAQKAEEVPSESVPKELNKVTLPPYQVEPPDVLLIDASRLIPLPPYKIEPLDVLTVYNDAPPQAPIGGLYPVDADGTINLGPSYGSFRVADLTVQEAEKVLATQLKNALQEKIAAGTKVSLAQTKGVQQIRGEHLLRPDGTVALGTYGSVYVAGLTLVQVKQAIETHLAQYLYKPEVSVDVLAYNSKYYYVITDFAGSGEGLQRFPSTGNETVLDAISMVGGLSSVSSKTIWVARPAPASAGGGDQILPVDWRGITRRGQTKTNYQVLPGDRVFVMSQPMTKFDTYLARTTAPIERALGTSLLGFTTFRTIQTDGRFGLIGNNNQ